MAVDLMGGVFSLLSLAFKEHFDVIAAVAYGAVVVSLLVLSFCHLWYWCGMEVLIRLGVA